MSTPRGARHDIVRNIQELSYVDFGVAIYSGCNIKKLRLNPNKVRLSLRISETQVHGTNGFASRMLYFCTIYTQRYFGSIVNVLINSVKVMHPSSYLYLSLHSLVAISSGSDPTPMNPDSTCNDVSSLYRGLI